MSTNVTTVTVPTLTSQGFWRTLCTQSPELDLLPAPVPAALAGSL